MGDNQSVKFVWMFFMVLGLVSTACSGNVAPPHVNQGGQAGGGASGGMAGDAPDWSRPPREVDFFIDVQPILGDHCVRCHGGVRRYAELDLITKAGVERVLVPGKPMESALLTRLLASEDLSQMPLDAKPLTHDQILTIRDWILSGAPWPDHWAFAPRQEPDPNAVSVANEAWIEDPLDRFVVARLEQAGLQPSPEAPRRTLVRRLHLDLLGLPPTPAALDAWLNDSSPTWYETLVDDLLAQPAFGERWGRHWLDQARYADSDGWGKDEPRPYAWRWRDWVIDAINKDMPFDQFTIEQVAGDLLHEATPSQKLAAGFHRQASHNKEGGIDAEEDRTRRVMDRVNTIGTVWMGLTLECAQCHDHTYDAISQKDFYRMYAFFNNADEFDEGELGVPGVTPGDRSLYTMRERRANPRPNHVFRRGVFLQPDESEHLTAAPPAHLATFEPASSTPDRLDLAKWLVSANNPLTARVVVNATWNRLFGHGIVATLQDFGSRASYPSHPALLEHLATSFVNSGWSRKALIKRLVTSATYRQDSQRRDDANDKDPENRLFHRQSRHRVEAEIVSDIALSAAGLLNTRVGGASVFPPIPPEVLGLSRYGTMWPTSTGADRYRRGMYTFHKRTTLHPNLQLFDRPSAESSRTGRDNSNTPLQALALLNDTTFLDAARGFAGRITREAVGTRGRIEYAFSCLLGRAPNEAEVTALQEVREQAERHFSGAPAEAESLIAGQAFIGVAPSEAAAWIVVSRVLLNTEEAFTRE